MTTDHAHVLAFNRYHGPAPVGGRDGVVSRVVQRNVATAACRRPARGRCGRRRGRRERLSRRLSRDDRRARVALLHDSETRREGIGNLDRAGARARLRRHLDARARTIPSSISIYWAIGNPCPDFNGEERRATTCTPRASSPSPRRPASSSGITSSRRTIRTTGTPCSRWCSPTRCGKASRASCCSTATATEFSTSSTGRMDRCFAPEICRRKRHGSRALLRTASRSSTRDRSRRERESRPVPAGGGGANFHAVSYNPVTRLFYVRVSDSCQVYTAHEDPLGARGNRWFGTGPPSEKARAALAELQKGYTSGAFIRAMDPFAAKKVWDLPNPGGEPGILSTASGLVFLPGDGGLLVLDGKSGKGPSQRESRPYLRGRADDLHGWRQAVHRPARHRGADRLRACTEGRAPLPARRAYLSPLVLLPSRRRVCL